MKETLVQSRLASNDQPYRLANIPDVYVVIMLQNIRGFLKNSILSVSSEGDKS